MVPVSKCPVFSCFIAFECIVSASAGGHIITILGLYKKDDKIASSCIRIS